MPILSIGMIAFEAIGAEWKFIGGDTLPNNEFTINYYDSQSVEYMPNGVVRVWMKSILQSGVEKMLNDETQSIIESTARKFLMDTHHPTIE
jgi:hypothetical protein